MLSITGSESVCEHWLGLDFLVWEFDPEHDPFCLWEEVVGCSANINMKGTS